MGQGSSYFVFIILEIPVPHIPKTHNFSSLCLIFLGYRSPPSFGHSRSLTSSSLLSIIPFLSVLRFTQSFNSLHTPIGPFIWDEKKMSGGADYTKLVMAPSARNDQHASHNMVSN